MAAHEVSGGAPGGDPGCARDASSALVASLLLVFGLEFLVLAVAPLDRHDWALENVLVVLTLGVLVGTWRRFRFTSLSYGLIFVFLCLHEVGAHYTYARVPYDDAFAWLTGSTFNELVGWQRNHFDRLVHFLFGLLLVHPLREWYVRTSGAVGWWRNGVAVTLVMAGSMLFELFEWGAAELFGGDLGVAYLGTQGDVWDAHKDMFLASLGGILGLTVFARRPV
ncbi:MAG: DUF2238 domain-containing protein [Pseudomonadales bacterium]|nr:DUF2238 domain-containing protein [Pseudomonadales bacterium]MCP5183174.1 DUF2238 domain-containing protein [Pseudomonadales bacterium]